mgnify:FL=1
MAFVAIGLLGSAAPAGASSCAGPELIAAEPAVAPGTTVLVSGWRFATCPASGDPEPATDVELLVRVNDQEKAVGSIDVSADFDFVLDLHIPPSLGTGEGAIIARWEGRPGGPVDTSVPITVAGSPGDAGDRPYFEIGARKPSSPDWLWLGLALLVGLALGFVLASLRRRRTTRGSDRPFL